MVTSTLAADQVLAVYSADYNARWLTDDAGFTTTAPRAGRWRLAQAVTLFVDHPHQQRIRFFAESALPWRS